MFDDLKGRLVEEMRPSGVTISIVMSRILENTGWTLGIVQSNSVASSSYYSQSTLSAFADAIEKWDVEFKPRLTFVDGIIVKKEIDIYDRLSKDYGRWFEYGDKLISVTAKLLPMTCLLRSWDAEKANKSKVRAVSEERLRLKTLSGLNLREIPLINRKVNRL
ncbi:phage tail protein [Erysipelothrix sp. D19-032]